MRIFSYLIGYGMKHLRSEKVQEQGGEMVDGKMIGRFAILHGMPEAVAKRTYWTSPTLIGALDDIYWQLLQEGMGDRWRFCNGELNNQLLDPCPCRKIMTREYRAELQRRYEASQ
jgi:hypothetical protein